MSIKIVNTCVYLGWMHNNETVALVIFTIGAEMVVDIRLCAPVR